MTTDQEIDLLRREMGPYVEPYVAAITHLPPNDPRDPPGDHAGTCAFVDINGVPHVLTCEHVVSSSAGGVFGYSRYGATEGSSVGRPFVRHNYPIDAALASLDRTWSLITPNLAQCLPPGLLATAHRPVEDEYLYVYGFPGSTAHAFAGSHIYQGVGVVTHEVEFDPALQNEVPKPIPGYHIVMGHNTAYAHLLEGSDDILPLAKGMSGSIIWNTRYREVTALGLEWTVADARVTALAWGSSTKCGLLVATPIEHVRLAFGF